MRFDEFLAAVPAGQDLHQALGDSYVAIAPLDAPGPGSVEAAVAGDGRDGLRVIAATSEHLDAAGIDAIRSQSAVTACQVPATFDAVLIVPSANDDPLAHRVVADVAR